MEDTVFDSPSLDPVWAEIYKLAGVPLTGPSNRAERRRVEKILGRLKRRGLTIS